MGMLPQAQVIMPKQVKKLIGILCLHAFQQSITEICNPWNILAICCHPHHHFHPTTTSAPPPKGKRGNKNNFKQTNSSHPITVQDSHLYSMATLPPFLGMVETNQTIAIPSVKTLMFSSFRPFLLHMLPSRAYGALPQPASKYRQVNPLSSDERGALCRRDARAEHIPNRDPRWGRGNRCC